MGHPQITTIIPRAKSTIPLLRTVQKIFSQAEAIRNTSADIVHVHFASGIDAWIAAAVTEKPLVVSTMGGDVLFDERGYISPLYRWLVYRVYQAADLITSKSDYITAALQKHGGYDKKTIKVVWGVSTRQFHRGDASALRARLGLGPDDLVILSPRRLKRQFNIHLLISALSQVVKIYPQAKLLVTEYEAEADYLIELRQQIAELELGDHVIFVGKIEHDDMPQLYSLADVAVGVTASDGLPQSVFEAMACEVPNILARLPHYEEVGKHKESAYFVDIDANSIAQAILELFRNRQLHQTIATNALHFVQTQVNFERDVHTLEQEYARLRHLPHKKRSVWRRTIWMVAIIAFALRQQLREMISSR